MKSKIIKKVLSVAVGVALMASISLSVSASPINVYNTKSETVTDNSLVAVCDTEKENGYKNITSTYKRYLYGGDMGVNFYVANNGLSAAFERSNLRTATINLYSLSLIGTKKARVYRMTFNTINGLYQPDINTVRISSTTSGLVSDNGNSNSSLFTAHVGIHVTPRVNDNSQNMPDGIIRYGIWAY